jgi:hypothetical protein
MNGRRNVSRRIIVGIGKTTYVRFGSEAEILERLCEVRFTPKSGH